MKKIYTLGGLLLLFTIVISSCSRRAHWGGDETDYWLTKENGFVVYSDAYCPYIVVETYYGYTIIRHNSGLAPYEGDEVFGDLSRLGYRQFYNYADGTIFGGQVTDYWLSYSEAQYLIDNLCYGYYRGEAGSVEKKQIKQGLYKKRG
ncbi:MAG: hypothetical protein NVV59_10140 [Chitinophagaceae bacterium]|nr:hypothetical protein [Chitinophagaceae bacterium]